MSKNQSAGHARLKYFILVTVVVLVLAGGAGAGYFVHSLLLQSIGEDAAATPLQPETKTPDAGAEGLADDETPSPDSADDDGGREDGTGSGPPEDAEGAQEAELAPDVRDAMAAESHRVVVLRGRSVRGVLADLETAEIIPSADALLVYARIFHRDASVVAGIYDFTPDHTPLQVFADLVAGRTVDPIRVTIPEGWRQERIAERLEAREIVSKDAFLDAAVMSEAYQDIDVVAHLADGAELEGYLFPESYTFEPGTDPEQVVRTMLGTLQNRLVSAGLNELITDGEALHETLTLASIVELEAPVEDMPEIAGVFQNRLDAGIRLESDATVNYVLGTSKLQPTFADTRVEDPYNTYRNFGLPPGPIGNPGMAAIEAAANPAEHDYYFFLHRPDRVTVFSYDFAEHLRNKARYLD